MIIGIDGSPQPGVVSSMLHDALQEVVVEGNAIGAARVAVQAVQLRQLHMPYHNGSYTDIPAGLAALFGEMREADGFIFATPVNWFNVSGLMKTFLDWLTSLEEKFELQGKVAGIIAHCNSDGGNQAAMALAGPLLHMGLVIPPCSAFYRNRFVAGQEGHEWQRVDQRLVGRNVVRMAKLMRRRGTVNWATLD